MIRLCQQISTVIGRKSENALSIDNPGLDSERLKIIFESLVQKVIEIAKKNNSTYYFVVDGLEWAFEGNAGERISDLLPLQTNSKYLYFLGSISNSANNLLDFSYLTEEPRTFSSLETGIYLEKAGITLSVEMLDKVQSISGGIPGYLSALRKLHVDQIQDIVQAIEKPSAIEDLLKIQWNAFAKKATNEEKIILSLIAYSVAPITISTISEIMENKEDEINRFFIASGLSRQMKDNEWTFYPDLLKKIAQDKLQNYKSDSVKRLIIYYENRKSEKEARSLLPEYYLLSNDYSGIENLLKPPYITKSIYEFGDLGATRRILLIFEKRKSENMS